MMLGTNTKSRLVADLLPDNSIGAELGVWKGESSRRFLQTGKVRWLHMVDTWSVVPYQSDDWDGYLDRYTDVVGTRDVEAFQAFYNRIHDQVRQDFAGDPVTIHRMPSAEFLATFPGQLDWIYIDASHEAADVLADLIGSVSVLRPAGILFGDDYDNPSKPGVTLAVDEFVRCHPGIRFEALGEYQFQCTRPA